MYLITVYNSGHPTVVHGDYAHVADCQITKEVNATDSMTFTIYPGNPGYDALVEFATIIECIDVSTGDAVFQGRVLSAGASMDSDGAAYKSVTCEGLRGYLNDSVQPYTEEKTWAGDTSRNGLQEFIDYLLANHNAHVPKEKRIYRGNVTVQTFKTTENVTKGTNFERTFDIIKEKLIDVFGGESQVRYGDDGKLYFDYMEKLGDEHSERISVGRNIESAQRELKPDQLITRLYPRGAKLTKTETDDKGTEREVETEDRLGIESVNAGKPYIDDDDAVKLYGIIEGTNEWDDVTEPANLKDKGERWLKQNNQLPASTTITGYDLSLLGYDAHRIRIHGWYPCYNPLIGLDERLEVVKQTINVSEPAESTWEFGETKATHSAIVSSLGGLAGALEYVRSQTKTNVTNIAYYVRYTETAIKVAEDSITSTVSERLDNFGGDKGITIESKISDIVQTAEKIEETVYYKGPDGVSKSRIEQLSDSLKSTIEQGYPYTDEDGNVTYVTTAISDIKQTAEGITLSVEQLEQGYGTCTTAAATAAKLVSIDGFKRLYKGATVCVKFSYANTASYPTLNVSDTGAKYMRVNGALMTKDYWWGAGDVATLVYDGSYWNVSDAGAKSKIKQLANSISLEVSGKLGGTASIVMSVDGAKQEQTIDMSGVREAFKNDTSAITISAGAVTFNSNTFVVNSTYFKVTKTGVITATSGTIGGFTIGQSSIRYGKSNLIDNTYGVYVGTDGISVGSGTAYAALAGGYLRGGNSNDITGYVGFNNYWTDTGKYGARLAGRGCLALLTDGPFGIGSYYSYGNSATITVGQSKTITFGTSLSMNFTFSKLYNVQCTNGQYYPEIEYISGYNWSLPRSSVTFTKGLMTTV